MSIELSNRSRLRSSSSRFARMVLFLAMTCFVSRLAGAWEPLPDVIEFNRDIRPILSDACYQCHGPDKANREANLRFDRREDAFADLGGYQAVVPGDLAKSELFRRIVADDEDDRMPPADSGRTLTQREIDLIGRWIEQGGEWQEHWSFIVPQRPALPHVKNASWTSNPIDRFILARLQREGLSPAPTQKNVALIRRVTLDLTGLPPTLGEVDAFLADESPDAYEKVVARLLASPRFGERWASCWLDAARYADTSGYQTDGPRYMWRWRDWVITALNENMPFDQFTIEQLAGDLFATPTLDQRIATGFNRNHRGNAEGGIIPEEYRVEYVVDRVETTSTVWLGLTIGCARCHDHKFDPISQREFYQLFAYFNNVPEYGRALKEGNSQPWIKAPTPRQQAELEDLDRELNLAESDFEKLQPQLEALQSTWEQTLGAKQPVQWAPEEGLIVHYPLNGEATDAADGSHGGEFEDGEATYAEGPMGMAGNFDGRRYVDAGDVADIGYFDKFSCGAWIHPERHEGGTILSRMVDTPRGAGYGICLSKQGRVQVNLVKRWLDDAIRVETRLALPVDGWHHVMATYDGSRVAAGIKIYVNGVRQQLDVKLDGINQSFNVSEPLRIGAGGGTENRFQGSIDEVRVYEICLSAHDVQSLAAVASINEIASKPPDTRSDCESTKLQIYFLEKGAPDSVLRAYGRLVDLRQAKQKLIERIPTTMVMQEMETPREAFVLLRGQYDHPGEKVRAGVPNCFPPLPEGAEKNRLGLARWLVHDSNPLTGRVVVNRYWQMLFGTGLVKTTGDFGLQGELPSHPQLLDWLATELVRNGWDVKATLWLMVTSATYRQSSRVTPELLNSDPENRMLARGPRFRLPTEMIRDSALMASGMLVERIGGPSVKPYQPEGLWKEIASFTDYEQSKGADLYRRGLYCYWKRTVCPPSMITFDASTRETCVVRKQRTNTPLQALTLMNETTFVESARVLAERVMKDGGETPEERITLAFRLVTGRPPSLAELRIFVAGVQRNLARYQDDQAAALQLVSTGEYRRDEGLAAGELAAYTVMANLILNLDEAITKE